MLVGLLERGSGNGDGDRALRGPGDWRWALARPWSPGSAPPRPGRWDTRCRVEIPGVDPDRAADHDLDVFAQGGRLRKGLAAANVNVGGVVGVAVHRPGNPLALARQRPDVNCTYSPV